MFAIVSTKPMSKCHAVRTCTTLTFDGSGAMDPDGVLVESKMS